MLTDLLKVLPTGEPVVIPEWDKLLSDLNDRYKVYTDRYILEPLNYSRGVRLLRQLIFNIDINYLLTHKDDFDRYTNYISYESENLKELFDPVYKGSSGSQNMFVDKQTTSTAPEYIVAVHMDNPMMNLPLGESWNTWSQLRPFRIWYHTSDELITNFTKGKVVFKEDLPSYCMSTIDLTLLMFKYVKYVEHVGIDKYSVDEFIKQHVLNNVLNDLRDIWLFNLVKAMAEGRSVDGTAAPSSYTDAITKATKVLDKYKNNNISLSKVLNTNWMFGSSLIDLMMNSNSLIKLPSMRQYLGLGWLKIRPSVYLVSTLNNLRTPNGTSKTFNKILRMKLKEYKRANFLDGISDPELKASLVSELSELESMIR